MAKKSPQLPALVADPSSHMAALVAVMLKSLKVRAVDATIDLPHTATELARQSYGLILIDEHLGGTDGFDMIRAIRRSTTNPNRETPIIMMAAAPDARMIAAARDAGVSEFLRKPFSAEHIKLRLDGLSKAPRPFVEAQSYAGPDRRRRSVPGAAARRAADKETAGS
jgi:two-component system chemotaxis response regulator CheY